MSGYTTKDGVFFIVEGAQAGHGAARAAQLYILPDDLLNVIAAHYLLYVFLGYQENCTSLTARLHLQHVPLLRDKQLLKQAGGKLVAHTADVIGHSAVDPLIVGNLHIEIRHQGRFIAQAGVQLPR